MSWRLFSSGRGLSVRLGVLLVTVGLSLTTGSATAADPPPTPAPRTPGGGFQPLATNQFDGTTNIAGFTCLGSGSGTGCGAGYSSASELQVIGTSNGTGPLVELMNNQAQSAPTVRWSISASANGLFLGNANNAGAIPFRISNLAPSNALVLGAGGKVGIGTTSPLTRLQVGSGTTDVATAGASLLTEEGVASSVIIKSTSGPEMFLYEDQNNGLMGTASNTPFGLRSNNQNRFWMTETGNVGIGTAFTNPVHLFQVGNSSGAFTDGTSWSNASSLSLKENFETTDDQAVLRKLVSLPVESWNYKTDGAGVRHLGPTAEDFMAAFGLGSTDKAISTVDADGVAMAAIKGLYEQVQAKDAELAAVNTKLDALQRRIDGGTAPAVAPSSGSSKRGGEFWQASTIAALVLLAFAVVLRRSRV